MGSRRGKAYQGLLVGLLLAPAAALEAGELTGTWQGAFSCGGTQFTWQLAIDEHTANRYAGHVEFTRSTDGAIGAHHVSGAYNPNVRRVSISGKSWIERMSDMRRLRFRGTYDPGAGMIAGQFVDTRCGSFEITRVATTVATFEPTPSEPDVEAHLAVTNAPDESAVVDVVALYTQGIANFFVPRTAIGPFSEVIAAAPQLSHGYRGRAWARLVDGDNAGAIADFTTVLRLEPEDSEAFRGRAWGHLQAGDFAASRADFDESVARSRYKAEGYAGRGLANYFAGNLEAARTDFRSTMRFEPGFNDAVVYTRDGQFIVAPATLPPLSASADARTQQSQHARPADWRLRSDQSTRLDDWRKYSKVMRRLRQDTQARPTDVDAWLASAVAQYRRLDDEPGMVLQGTATIEARQAFDRVVQIDPASIEALMSRAMFRGTARAGRDPRGAIEDLTRVIELNPNEVEAYFRRTNVQAASSDAPTLAKAVADCATTQSMLPNDPVMPKLCELIRGRYRQAEARRLAQITYEKGVKQYQGLAILLVFGAMAIETPGCEACELAEGMAGGPF
jgi:tetratricopeptide (TPR) repeat protein